MVDMSPFGWIWTFWHNILAWLYPGVGMTDTLPVTVAMIAFLILFYIAFRYFLFERLMKDVENKDLIINKLSIVISVSFSILGVYLGWIPFVAAMFGVFFGIIAIVFMFILGFAVAGMAKTAHAEYAGISADASKTRAEAMQTRSEGVGLINSIYKTAKDDIEEVKDTRQLYNNIEETNTTARQDLAAKLNVLQAFQKLHELLPKIVLDTQRGDKNLLSADANALQAPHTTLSAANTVFRFLRNKFENDFNKVKQDDAKLRDHSNDIKTLQHIDEKDFQGLENDLKTHLATLKNLKKIIDKDTALKQTYGAWANTTLTSINNHITTIDSAKKRLKNLDIKQTKETSRIDKLVADYEHEFKHVLDHEKTVYPKVQAGILKFNNDLSELMHNLPDVSQAAANNTHARNLRTQISALYSLVKIGADTERKLLALTPKFSGAIKLSLQTLTNDYNMELQQYNTLKAEITRIETELQNNSNIAGQVQVKAGQAKGKAGAGKGAGAKPGAPAGMPPQQVKYIGKDIFNIGQAMARWGSNKVSQKAINDKITKIDKVIPQVKGDHQLITLLDDAKTKMHMPKDNVWITRVRKAGGALMGLMDQRGWRY